MAKSDTSTEITKKTSLSNSLVVHYHRHDQDYSNVTLWTWDICHSCKAETHEVEPSGKTSFGVVFYLDPNQYGKSEDPNALIGIIPRKHRSWEHRDGGDKVWHPTQGREIWLVEDDDVIYHQEPDIRLYLQDVYLDDWKVLRAVFSRPVPAGNLDPRQFDVIASDGNHLKVESVRAINEFHGKTRVCELSLGAEIKHANDHVTVRFNGSEWCPMMPGQIQYNGDLFYTDEKLGAEVLRNTTIFRVFSPAATQVQVVLYEDPWSSAGRRVMNLEQIKAGVWERTVDECLDGKYYSLRVSTNKSPDPKEICDPFAINTISNPRRARLTNLIQTDPVPHFHPIRGPHDKCKPTDAIITELHIRDFTINKNSGVKHKGKYLGFVQEGTTIPNEPGFHTGIDHLSELGITHVQLLPVHKFDLDETAPEYNWGYMTASFFSPEGWFATETDDESRIKELKTLVHKLHERGIGVVLDVVYNHTGVMSTLEEVAPGYYHRMRPNGKFWNGSGCGNEFNSESPMGRKLILDSCRYWANEFGVDGFRFDLMGLVDLETMRQLRKVLNDTRPGLLLYGEPWTGGHSGLSRITDKYAISGTTIGAFNDEYRNALKGEPEGGHMGYVQNGTERDKVIQGLQGSIFSWANEPLETINYATCHDNLTLWDKLDFSIGHIGEIELKRMHLLTLAILSVSQGIPFFHGGTEFFRTKFGHHNSYNAPDSINQVDWLRKAGNYASFQYVADLIKLRRKHSLLRLSTAEQVRKCVSFNHDNLPVWSAIKMRLKNHSIAQEPWSDALVLINPDPNEQNFYLPEIKPFKWKIIALDHRVWFNGSSKEVESHFKVPGRSLAIIARY